MVMFDITYLRMNIFITWWMSIFQSIVVLRHCVSQFVHCHILGHTPFLREHRTFHMLHSLFNLVVGPCELHSGSYPHSLGSSNLSKALLSFDLVVDPHELSYWGISPPIEYVCIVILVILWLWVTWSDPCHVSFEFESGPHLYRSVILSSCQFAFQGCTYIDQPFSYQFEFILSFRDCTYIDRSFFCLVSLSQGRTYIDRPYSYKFVFSLSRGRTYID